MAPRAFGALLALVAALLFATALAGGLAPSLVPGWWDGHPIVDGKVRELKVIHVGLLEASGCNLGEEVKCQPLDINHRLEPVSYGELGALGVGALTLLLLAFSAWKIGDRRKLLAKLALLEVVVIGGGAAAIFFIRGPDLNVPNRLGLPVNLGLFAAIGGCGAGFLAGLLATRIEPEPLRLKSSRPSDPRLSHPQHQQPAFDVRELLRDNQQRMAPMPPSPGGPLAGPAGPLGGPMQAPSGGHVHGAQPLFETAPQLRPLYDLHNAGAQPNPAAPHLPMRAPTPLQPEQVRNILGFPTPPPLEAVTPPTRGAAYEDRGDSAAAHVPVAFGAEPYVPAAPPRSHRAPADQSGKMTDRTEDIPLERDSYDPMPAPPPAFGAAVPGSFGAPQPPAFSEPAPPANRHARPGTNVRKAAAAVGGPARAARPSVPPRITGTHRPTISAPVPPMPSLHGEPPEHSTSVEIDAEAKARARAGGDRPSEQAMTMPVERGEETDESMIAPPVARGDNPTDENAFVPAGESTAETQAPESFEELETRDARKFSEDELAHAHTELGPSRASSELPTRASPKVDIELPTAPERDGSPVVVDALARGESPARAQREAAPPAPDQTLDREDDIAPPPKPATAAPPPPSPAKPAAAPPSPPPARQRRVSGAPPPTNAAAVPVASFAIAPSAANPLPGARIGKPTEPPAPLQPKSAPIAAVAPAPPPAAAPAAPAAAPIASVPKGPLPSIAKPSVPLPRSLKPSVPPPASKFSGISTKNPVEPKPFMPSNLAAAASANKATTTSTPSPFATIPSPFAKPAAPAPADGAHEAATRPANLLDEAATVASTKPGLDAKLGEAPTVPARLGAAEPDSNEGATVRKSEPKLGAPVRPTPMPRTEAPSRPTPRPAPVPISTAPTSLPPPKQATQVSSGPTPACPQCEAPMAWVEEHLRFYCASCRMYF